MILSRQKILDAVENNQIGIVPFVKENLKEASYTFTLGNKLKKLRASKELDSRTDPNFDEVELSSEGYLLMPQEHILGATAESLSLKGRYACMLSTRATIAQMGLDVSQSSFYCEPDTDSVITLEISNSSGIPIRLYLGIKIVKGIFTPVG